VDFQSEVAPFFCIFRLGGRLSAINLKGQSHEKVYEIMIRDVSFGPN
jgi:hypothetical protein